MILSVSRRTDIPAFYSEWFINRIREGYLYVRNPMNIHQVSRINLSSEVVDCIVFWTKNPIPMIPLLDELKEYMYYFQFTVTGYENDIEEYLPSKSTKIIPAFIELSNKIGKERVIWRYDPILFNEKYSPEFHIRKFEEFASLLEGHTEKCVISFVDVYVKNKHNIQNARAYEILEEDLEIFSKKLAEIAHNHNMSIASCAELVDLDNLGIAHNRCIDGELIEKLIGYKLNIGKDKTQRAECGCAESIDVGTYNTCRNGCMYCYANYDNTSLVNNCKLYDPSSPFLCSKPISEMDKITERKVKSFKGEPIDAPQQLSLFDYFENS